MPDLQRELVTVRGRAIEAPRAVEARSLRERIAALDLGSNAFRLLVVDVDPRGSTTVVATAREAVRLGAATLSDGVLSPATVERGLAALAALRKSAADHHPDVLLAVGTSVLREASNGPAFVAAAQEALGIAIRIVDGAEEARLVFSGALGALALGHRRVALFDVGGGSTEAVLGDHSGSLFTTSLKLGVLRLRDGWPLSDPPRKSELAPIGDWARTLLRPTLERLRELSFDFVALTAGTAKALARLAGEPLPDAGPSGLFRLTLEALRIWEALLAAAPARERVERWGVDPGRADTIVPGAIVLRSILELAGVDEAQVCTAALREGMIAEYLAQTRAPSPGSESALARVSAARALNQLEVRAAVARPRP